MIAFAPISTALISNPKTVSPAQRSPSARPRHYATAILSRRLRSVLLLLPLLLDAAVAHRSSLSAATIPIPNGSFESPEVVFVDTNFDAWQKGPKPPGYVEEGGFFWSQLTGVFKNPAPGKSDHLDNCDGAQALWLFAVPEVALFQDYDSVDWNDPAPSHSLNTRFTPGKAYSLKLAVNGGGGGMKPNVTLRASLYYRDANSNQVPVASTVITHSTNLFPNQTHLIDFDVRTPIVTASDPWAHQHLGIQLLSTVSSDLQGGYWDIDHIRLAELQPPKLVGRIDAQDQLLLTVHSDVGSVVQISATDQLAHSNLTNSWIPIATLTNDSGSVSLSIPPNLQHQRFFRSHIVDWIPR